MIWTGLWEALCRFATGVWLPWLGGTVARTSALLIVAILALVALRRASAAVRHLALTLTLGSVLTQPFLSVVLPSVAVHLPAVFPAAPRPEMGPAVDAAAMPRRTTPHATPDDPARAETEQPPAPAAPATPITEPLPSAASHRFDTRDGAAIALVFWISGAALILGRTMYRHIALSRWACRSTRITEGTLRMAADQAVHAMGVQRALDLRLGAPEDPPMTWGWRRPVLLVPTTATAWPPERVRAVLLHEAAHVSRWDWPIAIVARIACALHWPNPLVWWCARRLQQEAEHACDDRVLLAGVSPTDYAAQLVAVVRSLRSVGWTAGPAVAMAAQPSLLPARVRSILDTRRRTAPSPAWTVAGSTAAAMLVAFVAALRGASAHPQPESLLGPDHAVSVPATAKVPLLGGATVEITRISGRFPDGSLRFWWPDGSSVPPDEIRRYRRDSGSHFPTEVGQRFLYARITAPEGGIANYRWEGPARDYVGGWQSGGATMPYGWDTYVGRHFPSGTRRATVRLAVASGGWQRVATATPDRVGKSTFGPAKYPVTVEIAPVPGGVRLDGRLHVTVTGPTVFLRDDLYALRLRAIGSGQEETELRQIGIEGVPGPDGNARADFAYGGWYSYLRHPADHREAVPALREVRLEVCPYRWAAFRDVPLTQRVEEEVLLPDGAIPFATDAGR
jgi:beta-lactamase regulating signal transducer with metallopeptidase domain